MIQNDEIMMELAEKTLKKLLSDVRRNSLGVEELSSKKMTDNVERIVLSALREAGLEEIS